MQSTPNGNSHFSHEPMGSIFSRGAKGRGVRDSFLNNYWEGHINGTSTPMLIQVYGIKLYLMMMLKPCVLNRISRE